MEQQVVVLFRVIKNKTGMYVCRNIEARSCNHSCSGKAIINTYSECVSVALGIEYAMRMYHIVKRGLSGSRLCFHIIEKSHDFREKKVY
jgi:hypothetical protein